MLTFSALKSWSPNLKRVKFSLCFRDLNLLRLIWDFVMWTRRQVVRWLARQKKTSTCSNNLRSQIEVVSITSEQLQTWTQTMQRKPLLWFFCIVCVIFYRWLYLNCCLVQDTLGKWCEWCEWCKWCKRSRHIFQKLQDFGLALPAPQHFAQSFPSGEPLTRLFEPRPRHHLGLTKDDWICTIKPSSKCRPLWFFDWGTHFSSWDLTIRESHLFSHHFTTQGLRLHTSYWVRLECQVKPVSNCHMRFIWVIDSHSWFWLVIYESTCAMPSCLRQCLSL